MQNLVKNEDSAMECEIYEQWFHIKNQNITKTEYNYIKISYKKKSLSMMHWCCKTYDTLAVNITRIIANLHTHQGKIEERMSKLKDKIIQEVDK